MARCCLFIFICVSAIALVDYGCYGATEESPCMSLDCLDTADILDGTIDWNINPCVDFYEFSCGSAPATENDNTPMEAKISLWIEQLRNLTKLIEKNLMTEERSEDPLEQLAIQYRRSCQNNGVLSSTGLNPIVRVLDEANQSESWEEVEKRIVGKGLKSSFFRTYAKGTLNEGYREFVRHESYENFYSVYTNTRVDGSNDTIMIDLRPESNEFFSNNFGAVTTYIQLLKEAGLKQNLVDSLKIGSRISYDLDRNLTEEFRIRDSKSIAVPFFRQHYTRIRDSNDIIGEDHYNRGYRDVHWQDLWDCGIVEWQGDQCRFSKPTKKFDWMGYLRDNYWGTVASSPDSLPLLEHESPEHWVLTPYLITSLRRFIDTLSNTERKSLILWRTARQLVEYASDETRNAIGMPGRRNCWPEFFKPITEKHVWYKVFPEAMRTQVNTMFTDIDDQMIYLRNKRSVNNTAYSYEKNKFMKKLLEEFKESSWRPKFPYVTKYTEPIINIKAPREDANYIEVALEVQRLQRALLLRKSIVVKEDDDMKFFVELLRNPNEIKFMTNRPASLNYGALGSDIGIKWFRKFTEWYIDNDDTFRNTRSCLAEHFRSDFYYYGQDIFQGVFAFHSLEAALNAFKIYSQRHKNEASQRLPEDRNNHSPAIRNFSQDQLFFLSFANSHCNRINSKRLVNAAVVMLPEFGKAFQCAKLWDRDVKVTCGLD